MNNRLTEIIRYKTGGKKKQFADMMGWTPQYITKLINGENFGLSPVLKIIEAIPELNARWFLTGEGKMLTEERLKDLSREALGRVQQLMDIERLIPVMTAEELNRCEKILTGQREAVFSPSALSEMTARASERIEEINAKFAAATAKSKELCRQKIAKE